MIIIGGPTNSGKTGLAIEIAKIVDAEVISADSRQIYKNMDVGTGKIPIGSNVKIVKNKTYWIVDGVKVWGFDLINPDEIYSAADFFNYYSKVRKNIESRGKEVILAGGTGFYIDTVLRNGVSSTVKVNHILRQKLNKLTAEELIARLPSAVAQTLNSSERQNKQRLIRKVEIYTELGHMPTEKVIEKTSDLFIILQTDKKILYEKIDLWVETIWIALIEETKQLIQEGYSTSPQLRAIIYRTAVDFVEGKVEEKVARQQIKFDLHAYIRRQITWFKKYKGVADFVDISDKIFDKEITLLVKSYVNKNGK